VRTSSESSAPPAFGKTKCTSVPVRDGTFCSNCGAAGLPLAVDQHRPLHVAELQSAWNASAVRHWSVRDVQLWLENIVELPQYVPVFRCVGERALPAV